MVGSFYGRTWYDIVEEICRRFSITDVVTSKDFKDSGHLGFSCMYRPNIKLSHFSSRSKSRKDIRSRNWKLLKKSGLVLVFWDSLDVEVKEFIEMSKRLEKNMFIVDVENSRIGFCSHGGSEIQSCIVYDEQGRLVL